MVDINEVVFFEDEFRENKDDSKEVEGNDEEKTRKRKKRRVTNNEEEEEESNINDESAIGLVMSKDFIPDDVFERSLCSGKRELIHDTPSSAEAAAVKEDGMVALVLSPTRELALQIKTHMDAVSKHTGIHVRLGE